jgi:dipeptidyl aminopeptidase/acylaminoacyl peptidase
LYIKDAGGDENFQLYAVNRDGSEAKDLTPFEDVRIELIDDLEDIEEEIIVGMNKENPMLFEPYRMNIVTGELEKLADNKDPMNPISTWLTDHEGKLRAASRVSGGTNTQILYRDSEAEEFTMVLETDFREGVRPVFFDFEQPHVVWAVSNLNRDKDAVVKFDMKTGEETELIFEHPEVDVSGVTYSRKRRVPLRVPYTLDKRESHFLDATFEKHYKHLEKELEGYEVVVTSLSKAEDKWLIRTYSDKSLGAYYLYKTEDQSLTHIEDVSPWIDESKMADMEPVKYQSRDGMTIPGYLTLPKGQEAKDLPVVVMPHGGPWHRDAWGWDPIAQMLANRGYAVL